jgi:hypothetical protein
LSEAPGRTGTTATAANSVTRGRGSCVPVTCLVRALTAAAAFFRFAATFFCFFVLTVDNDAASAPMEQRNYCSQRRLLVSTVQPCDLEAGSDAIPSANAQQRTLNMALRSQTPRSAIGTKTLPESSETYSDLHERLQKALRPC